MVPPIGSRLLKDCRAVILASGPGGRTGWVGGWWGSKAKIWDLFRPRKVIRAANQGSQQGTREALAEGWLDILGFLSKQLTEIP